MAQISIQLSEIVTIKYQLPEVYALSPNPTTETVTIDLSLSQGRAVELALMTPLGIVVRQEKIASVSTPQHTWDLNGIENGHYYLKIQTQGRRLVMKKLVVIK